MVLRLFLSQNEQHIVALAKSWIGTPYRHQASAKHIGCDCLGLVLGIWRELYGAAPSAAENYSRDWAETAVTDHLLDAAQLHLHRTQLEYMRPGDVLVFKWSEFSVSKHLGIYIGDGKMIHAFERHAVCAATLVPQWRKRISGVFSFPSFVN